MDALPRTTNPILSVVEVEGFFGWPDEELGISEEFVSVGEALHEDVYFNIAGLSSGVGRAILRTPDCGSRSGDPADS